MQRRHLLRALAAAPALPWAWAARANPIRDDFDAARGRHAWTLGYAGLQADAEPMALRVQGRVPRELIGGAFWRNGPARHQVGDFRYGHWFDGDGLLQRYRFTADGGVEHQARFLRTPKFLADSQAGRPVRAAFGTEVPGAEPPAGPDEMNVANTSVLWHGQRLLALWEGGSATAVDPETLATRGLHTWRRDLAGMPFSAHPRVEPDGTLWNFGVSSQRGLLTVYRVGADGALQHTQTLPVPQVAMVHDFAVTERHLVFLLPPFVFAPTERTRTFLDAHVWQPALGLRVLVLPKAALDQPRWFELPASFVFHIGNACEEGGVIRLDAVRTPDARLAQVSLRELMHGRYDDHGLDQPQPLLIELDLARGQARQSLLAGAVEFPRVDPRVVGRPYRQVFAALRHAPGPRPGFDAVQRLDVVSGHSERHVYGPDHLVEEHVFVPRPGSRQEGDGWLVGTTLDLQRQAMRLAVFDARRLADGPLMQAEMPRVMPLGLHGQFVLPPG